ncbi:MAG: protein phosphatase 2C domain-containing protein [Planctomycetota bacterium]|jgi:serine/threonine protein phosphatase PrpC
MITTVTHVVAAGKRGQDRAEVIETDRGVVVVVADGAGGSGGGKEAADSVVMWAKALVSRGGDLGATATWLDLLTRVDAQLEAAGGGQTTAVVAAVTDSAIVGASVGDSAAWLIGSEGHTNLTAEQVRKPLLGSGRAKPVAFTAGGSDDTLLVATDGLVKYASVDRVCAAARKMNLHTAAAELVDLVRLKSGALPDDVGLALCRRAP